MGTAKNLGRKNFRCIFNNYITQAAHDGIVQSIISQFQGYFAEPEVTLVDNGFILSLTLSDELTATAVRDKILWNRYIERVTTQDAIRKIQILRLPKALKEDTEGTVGAFGPHATAAGGTGIDEVDGNAHLEYRIDMHDRPDGPPFVASVKYADPTGNLLPTIYGPGAETGKPADEDLKSDITKMHEERNTILGFRIISTSQGEGSSFTMNPTNGLTDLGPSANIVNIRDRQRAKGIAGPATGIGGGADISAASMFVYDPSNAQGTKPGDKRLEDDNEGYFQFAASIVPKPKEEEAEFPGPNAATYEMLGVLDPTHAMGGIATGSINFGLNETYDYLGDVDDYEF